MKIGSGGFLSWLIINLIKTIWMKIGTGMLITNLYSKIKNSKWRIQYGGLKIQKVIWFGWKLLIEGFRVRWL